MHPDRYKDVLMVVTGAVVYGPSDQALFRELAYSRSPNCTVGEILESTDTWRIATPHRFNSLTDDQKEGAENMRRTFGMMFQPTAKEKALGCIEQYQIYDTMKETWLAHKEDSGQATAVYYQKEVGHLLKTLGIPATSVYELFQDEEAEAYDPLKDDRQFRNFVETCGIQHYGRRPCQGLLARRLAEFVWSKMIVSEKTQEEAEECREEIIDKTEALEKTTLNPPEEATIDLKEDTAIQIPECEETDVFEDATGDMPGDGLVSRREGKSWDQF